MLLPRRWASFRLCDAFSETPCSLQLCTDFKSCFTSRNKHLPKARSKCLQRTSEPVLRLHFHMKPKYNAHEDVGHVACCVATAP